MKRCTNQTSVCFIEIHQGKCDGYNLYDGLLCEHWQEPPAQMPQPGHGLIVPQGTLETKTGSNSKTAEIEPQPMPLKSGWSQAYISTGSIEGVLEMVTLHEHTYFRVYDAIHSSFFLLIVRSVAA